MIPHVPKRAAPKSKSVRGERAQPPIQPVAKRFPALEEQEVVLELCAPAAKSVQVAGTFNDWRPEANPMVHTGSGEWEARLMLRAGQYEYRFVVDGVWQEDPEATRSAPNPYGGVNSVLFLGLDDSTDLL
jgi:5'-AMP-activated protein kinase regulatory beta subunit